MLVGGGDEGHLGHGGVAHLAADVHEELAVHLHHKILKYIKFDLKMIKKRLERGIKPRKGERNGKARGNEEKEILNNMWLSLL